MLNIFTLGFLLFVGLKFTIHPEWSWWFVFGPLWVGLLCVVLVAMAKVIIELVEAHK
jgi:hypothetical protein